MPVLYAMPLVWCGVLIVLFAAHLAAGLRSAASTAATVAATVAALAASIAGIQPWMQVALLGLSWLVLRLCSLFRANE